MRAEAQVSTHLLMAGVVSVFSTVLILVTLAMSWELWIVPLIVLGCIVVWWLHIGRVGSGILYENMCAWLMLGGFFFFGVHKASLYEIPSVACVLLLVFSFLNRKCLLYITGAFYMSVLLYHFLFFMISQVLWKYKMQYVWESERLWWREPG